MTAPSATVAVSGSPVCHRRVASLLRLAVGALALLALSRVIRSGDLRRALEMVRGVGWPLFLVLLPTPIAMMLDAYGWRAILATLGHSVGWGRLVELRLSVEAIVLAMPGGSVAGEAAKVSLLDRRARVPLTTGAASLALTKLLLIATDAAYLAFIAIALGLAGGAAHAPTLHLALAGAAFTGAAAVGLQHLLRRSRFASWTMAALGRAPIARVRRWVLGRQPGLAELDRMAQRHFDSPRATRLRCAIPFMLEWFSEGLETFIIVRCLGLSLGLGDTLALDGIGSLVRAVAVVVPAGLGVQDGAQIMLLSQMGVPDPTAAGAAFVFTKRTKEVFWIVMGLLFLAGRRDLWKRAEESR